MDSRQEILDRIRQQLSHSPAVAAATVAAEAAVTVSHPRPAISGDLQRRFIDQSLRQSTTVDVIADWSTIPTAVARYLTANALPTRVVGWPLLLGHPWSAAAIDFAPRGARDDDAVGVTGCQCAIAETGTLMLLSGPDTPATVSLLPETHIAIVAASRIVATMEDAWQQLPAAAPGLPRAVNFISGPSRTGDIEQTIVLGAHGPYRVHVVLVSGA
jgi:L-lactate dehydrogenase complex protein LldG